MKKLIINLLLEGEKEAAIKSKISVDYKKLIEEIQETSSIKIILKTKDNESILELLDELTRLKLGYSSQEEVVFSIK